MCSGGEIEIEWTLAFSDRVRSSKYQDFFNMIPCKYSSSWQHNFRGDGSIVSSFSTTLDHDYNIMVQIVDDYAKATIYPYSTITHRPNNKVPSVLYQNHASSSPPRSGRLIKQTQPQLFPHAGKKRKPPRYSEKQMREWQSEKDNRRDAADAQRMAYKARMEMDPAFAAKEKEWKKKKLERTNAIKVIQADRSKMNFLFGKVFGNERWGDKCNEYFHRTGSKLMPVGKGMFFDGSHFFNSTTMLSKEDLYEVVSETNKDLKCKCTNCLDLMLRGRCVRSGMAALREGLPPYEDYDMWYRSLPLHVDFLNNVKDEEIHYRAPRSQQPDFPFIYVTWAIDAIDDPSSDEEYEH